MLEKLKEIYRDPRAWPPLEEEIGDYKRYFKGKVLNAGSGDRDISYLVEGRLYNQDLTYGPDDAAARKLDFTGPLHEIPVADGFFDCIICNAVMEHLPNPGEVMDEFYRATATGGYLYLCVPFLQPEHKCPTDFQRYTYDGLAKLAADHGYEVLEGGPVHTVYHTLAWIMWDWLKAKNTIGYRLLRLVAFPWLRRQCLRSKTVVPGLASAHRVLARKKTPEAKDPEAEFTAMTAKDEREHLRRYAAEVYTGAGELVELGSWLGSLTIPMLKGLGQNKNPAAAGKGIHVYDLFIWQDWMDEFVSKEEKKRHGFKKDASFLSVFAGRIQPWQERALIYAGDLCQIGWNGRPIEMLVVDAMKSWELFNAIVSRFFPSLMAGKGLVFEQDFVHYRVPWILLWHYRYRDYFKSETCYPWATTVVFKLAKPLPPEAVRGDFSINSFTGDELEKAFDYCAGLLPEAWQKDNMAAAQVAAYIMRGDKARATAAYEAALQKDFVQATRNTWKDKKDALAAAKEMLEKMN